MISSTMFVNTVSIKDLFSTNSGRNVGSRQDPGESTIDSGSQGNSQFPYSQVEFSESQDGNSQSCISMSQTSADSPGKKFYQRYMSKGPVFARDARPTPTTSQPQSYHQQIAANKAKAKERDERDILNTMLSTVKCTASEVKDVVSVMKQEAKIGQDDTRQSLQQHLENIESRLGNYNDELLKALAIRDEVKEQVNTLQTKLVEREMYIKGLKDEIATLRDSKEESTLSSIAQLFKDDHRNLQDHIQDLYAQHETTLKEQGSAQNSQQEELIQQTLNQHKQLAIKVKTAISDIGKSLRNEMRSQWTELQTDHTHFGQHIMTEFQSLQEMHMHQLQDIFSKQLKDVQNASGEKVNRLLTEHQQCLYQLQQRQKQQLQDLIKEQVSSMHADQKEQMDAIFMKCLNKAENTMTAQKEKQLSPGAEQLQNLKKRHEMEMATLQKQRLENEKRRRNDSFGDGYDLQASRQHVVNSANKVPSDRERIRSGTDMAYTRSQKEHFLEGEHGKYSGNFNSNRQPDLNDYCDDEETNLDFTSRPTAFPLASPLMWTGSTWSDHRESDMTNLAQIRHGDRNRKVDIQFTNRNPNNQGFVSPLTGIVKSLNSKTLFKKPSPSPVATVRPMMQPQTNKMPEPKKQPKKRKKKASIYGKKKAKKNKDAQKDVTQHGNTSGRVASSQQDPEPFMFPYSASDGRQQAGHSTAAGYHGIDNYDLRRRTSMRGKEDKRSQQRNYTTERRAPDRKDIFEGYDEFSSTQRKQPHNPQQPLFTRKTYGRAVAVAPQPCVSLQPRLNTFEDNKDESDSEDSDALLSQDSSPSLSVKEVFIKHIYKNNRTPVNPDGVSETNIYMQERHQSNRGTGMTSRFLSSSRCIDDVFGRSPLEQMGTKSQSIYDFCSPQCDAAGSSSDRRPEPMVTRRTQRRKNTSLNYGGMNTDCIS